jgi:hypothetical protein
MSRAHCEWRAELSARVFARLPAAASGAASKWQPVSGSVFGCRISFCSDLAKTRYPRRVIADFHLIALQLGSEEQMLERAVSAIDDVEPGETVFFPEYLAWTPRGSGRAFARLIALAQARNINIVTSLNVGPDLHEDLPGRDPEARYNALVIFTRHGVVHVPQAKVTPQSFEMDAGDGGPGIAVTPYDRINRVRLDWQDTLVETRFLICSDVAAFLQFSPAELACDLLVVVGNFAYGAERAASRLLERAIEAGVATTTFHINAFHTPSTSAKRPLALKVEEVLDATTRAEVPAAWPNPRAMRSGFHVYDDDEAHDFVSMCNLPRRGRVAIPRSRWKPALTLGEYPITVSL